MRRRSPKALLGLLAFLLCSCTIHEPRKMQLGYWYWNTGFSDRAIEPELQPDILIVKGGTFTYDGDELLVSFPQSFSASAREIHLAFNFDAGALSHFEFLDLDKAAASIVEGYRRVRLDAEESRARVVGLQLDIDVPTRLLPRYADLLTRVDKLLNPKDQLSITSLPTWFNSSDFKSVLTNVDFYAPQFYEPELQRTMDQPKSISDLPGLKRGLDSAEKLGKPFYAGICGYGRALMFDDSGALIGTYPNLSVQDALRHSSFEFVSGREDGLERELIFKAVAPDENGNGKDYRLVYRLPTAELIQEQLRIVQARQANGCRGSIVFRYPEPNESGTVPIQSLAAQLEGTPLVPRVEVSAETTSWPFKVIEGGRQAQNVVQGFITIANTGNGDSAIDPAAVQIIVTFPEGLLSSVQKGEFASVQAGRISPNGEFVPSSTTRANAILCSSALLPVGSSLRVGPMAMMRAVELNVQWQVMPESGERIKGMAKVGLAK